MSKPCTVCARVDRSAIDVRLAQQVVNVRALATELGLGREALRSHRAKHLPGFLVAFSASAKAPALGTLMAEYQRLYLTALDELAQAQAGVIAGIDKDGNTVVKVSSTAISRQMDHVRKALDRITALAADAATEDERPTGVDKVLADRMARALEGVMSRAASAANSTTTPALPSGDDVQDAEVLDEDDAAKRVAGGQAVEPGAPSSSSMSLDAAIAPENLPGITPQARKALADSARSDGTNDQANTSVELRTLLTVPNPSFPGSIEGSSSEERKAMGYPDIELTLDDLKAAAPTVVAELVRQRSQRPTP